MAAAWVRGRVEGRSPCTCVDACAGGCAGVNVGADAGGSRCAGTERSLTVRCPSPGCEPTVGCSNLGEGNLDLQK